MVALPYQTPKQKVALVIQYLGTHFYGWQRQLQQRTVQGEIEKVLKKVLGYQVTLHCAGRTDTGVHAAAQVAHFEHNSLIPSQRWASVLNGYLPTDILIRASESVSESWHARFSAQWRRYRYTLYTDPRPNLFVSPFSWHYYYAPLDESEMQAALKTLLGTHHLAAFHRTGSRRSHSWVEVQQVKCDRALDFIHIEIQANGFLYGMVRLLVGLLVQVGTGKRSLEEFTELWQQERREEVKHAAPACGLCLLRVGYEDSPFPPEVWFDTMPKLVLPST